MCWESRGTRLEVQGFCVLCLGTDWDFCFLNFIIFSENATPLLNRKPAGVRWSMGSVAGIVGSNLKRIFHTLFF